jgi:hypothetical protein
MGRNRSVVVAGQEGGSELGLGAVVALRTVLAVGARAAVAAFVDSSRL